MSGIEDQLRNELRTRADAAQDAADAGRLATPFANLDARIGRARSRRKLAATGVAAVTIAAVTAAIVTPLALTSPGPAGPLPVASGLPGPGGRGVVPLSDPSLSPPGWSPVTYRDAQISVPSSWVVQPGNGSLCGVTTHGGAWLGHRPDVVALRRSGCRLPATTVFVSAIGFRSRPAIRQHVNGIPAALRPGPAGSLSEVVPTLGVKVTALGPKARQVLATLTSAPLAVVLAGGPAPAVPAGWRWFDFAGIRFAAPEGWSVRRADWWGRCTRPVLAVRTLLLSTARKSGCKGTVPMYAPLARFWPPTAGAAVGSGPLSSGPNDYATISSCMRLRGLRACLPGGPGYPGAFGTPLELIVFVPGRALPTVVEIGLAGTGEVPRTILRSIGPARS